MVALAMNAAEVVQIVRELGGKHPTMASGCDLTDLERTLAILPEQAAWRVADGTPVVLALHGDTSFRITVSPAPAYGEICPVAMTSRALDGHKLVARMEWGELVTTDGGEAWRRSHWTFRYSSEEDQELDDWQQVTGMVRVHPEPERLDRDEQYARSLLSRVGRRVAVWESAPDQEPHGEEPLGAETSAQTAPSRQRVTDIWGQPLRPKRRGR
jgi:hypothetical protein